jgi:hypothetical protein
VSMKNLLRRATTAATEPGPQAYGFREPRQAEARIRMAPRFRVALSDEEFRNGLQNGDVK